MRPELSNIDDVELARRICQGPAPDAEAELFRRLSGRLLVVARRYVDGEAAAADLVQDAAVLLFETLRENRMRDLDKLHSFLFGVVRRLAADRRRNETLHASLLARHATALIVPPPPPPDLDLERLQQCIERLSARERGIVLASFWAGQSADEIASELSLTSNHIRVIRHRAIRNLSRCIGHEVET